MNTKLTSLDYLIMIFLAASLSACGKGFNQASETASEIDSQSSFQVELRGVTEDQELNGPANLIVSVQPIEKVKSLRILVNGKELKKFFRIPFEASLIPGNYQESVLNIQVEVINKNNQLTLLQRKVRKPTQSIGGDGVRDPNCLMNNQFDACVFYKNPVATRGLAYAQPVRMGTDLKDSQIYGVKLRNLSDPNRLQNNSIRVLAGEGDTATPINGRWIKDYSTDGNNQHYTAQVMAYYWLNQLEEQMVQRTGEFYARNRNIPVNAFVRSVKNNAYWDSRNIVMGVAQSGGQDTHEMALSAEVYIHEMGHANLQFATGRQLVADDSTTTCNSSTCFCKTAQGCVGAINEGQADFHMFLIFPEKPYLGETWINNINGLSSRNVIAIQNTSLQQQFNSTNGQIHSMGAFYASMLWNIYNNPQVAKREFERIFMRHLRLLTETATFASGRNALIAIDTAEFNGKYAQIIRDEFSRRGVN